MTLQPFERLELYAILASLFRSPDSELIEMINDLDAETLAQVFQELDEIPRVESNSLEDLQADYTCTFVNRPGGLIAPPYGSIYLEADNQVMGESTRRVERFYATAGVELGESSEPADFLAIELEFMAYLIDMEITAEEEEDPEQIQLARHWQQTFFNDHIGWWTPLFCDKLEQAPLSELYRWAVNLLSRFIALEHRIYSADQS